MKLNGFRRSLTEAWHQTVCINQVLLGEITQRDDAFEHADHPNLPIIADPILCSTRTGRTIEHRKG